MPVSIFRRSIVYVRRRSGQYRYSVAKNHLQATGTKGLAPRHRLELQIGDSELQDRHVFRYLVYLNNHVAGEGGLKTMDLCDQKTAP